MLIFPTEFGVVMTLYNSLLIAPRRVVRMRGILRGQLGSIRLAKNLVRDWNYEGYYISRTSALVLVLLVWGGQLANKKVIFHIDNMTLVSILNKKKTSRSNRVMQFLRRFVLLTLQHNIIFTATHISTHQNATADGISRFQFDRFCRLAPNASPNPAKIPKES